MPYHGLWVWATAVYREAVGGVERVRSKCLLKVGGRDDS